MSSGVCILGLLFGAGGVDGEPFDGVVHRLAAEADPPAMFGVGDEALRHETVDVPPADI